MSRPLRIILFHARKSQTAEYSAVSAYTPVSSHEQGACLIRILIRLRRRRWRVEGGTDGCDDLELGRALVVGHAVRRHAGLEVLLVPADGGLRIGV